MGGVQAYVEGASHGAEVEEEEGDNPGTRGRGWYSVWWKRTVLSLVAWRVLSCQGWLEANLMRVKTRRGTFGPAD
jgi:hypothetical protein